ncbi:MAG: type I-C CRISPR-associated protein Cas8c/Csd1 [Leptospiraceae bacterium]|nr:type I-C CRISPR-associated protein Cas8c/Csd1 [Leptospiraceae bacterium]
MILNDLVRYYERKLEAGEISPPGFEMREIPYLIEIDKKGAFVQFTSTWMDEKQKRARSFRVPHAVKRSSGVAANLLWDTCAYVFGVSPTGKDSKADRLAKQKDEFQSRIDVLAAGCEDEGLQAVVAFLKSPAKQLLKSLQKDPLWEEIVESGRNLSFKRNT